MKPYCIQRPHRPIPEQAGFTLLELVTALFILVTGLMGALTLFTIGMSKVALVDEYGLARTAVQNEMETLRALPFEALEPGERDHFTGDVPAAQLPGAQPRVVVRPADLPGLKEVSVTLSWRGENGRRVERSLTTFIADSGP